MDTKELLNQVIDAIVNEDDEAAKVPFKQYAQLKVTSLVESDMAKKKKKKCDTDEDGKAEDEANTVISQANKDD